MKEKIIKILRKYSDFDEDDHKESQEFNSMTGDFEKLINVEVEKRIAERMPSEAEKRAKARHLFVDGLNVLFACEEYDKWLRSRLTNPDNNLKQNSNGSAN